MLLFKGFEPLIGAASIQYANGEDWDHRQKCLYKTLKGEELKGYFSKFVAIAQVSEDVHVCGVCACVWCVCMCVVCVHVCVWCVCKCVCGVCVVCVCDAEEFETNAT